MNRVRFKIRVKRFLENRKINKPVELTESECSTLFMLLPHLDIVFEEAVKILCKGNLPSSLDSLFWYKLEEENLTPSHSHSIAKLLFMLLYSIKDLGYGKDNVIQIVNLLEGLEEKKKKELQEALLKHSINVSLT